MEKTSLKGKPLLQKGEGRVGTETGERDSQSLLSTTTLGILWSFIGFTTVPKGKHLPLCSWQVRVLILTQHLPSYTI